MNKKLTVNTVSFFDFGVRLLTQRVLFAMILRSVISASSQPWYYQRAQCRCSLIISSPKLEAEKDAGKRQSGLELCDGGVDRCHRWSLDLRGHDSSVFSSDRAYDDRQPHDRRCPPGEDRKRVMIRRLDGNESSGGRWFYKSRAHPFFCTSKCWCLKEGVFSLKTIVVIGSGRVMCFLKSLHKRMIPKAHNTTWPSYTPSCRFRIAVTIHLTFLVV